MDSCRNDNFQKRKPFAGALKHLLIKELCNAVIFLQ